ncbi:MAG TPA: hypothetical protein PKL17_03015 [Pseudomonadota bacterium]|jgi:hypothetical protein|nr:hypothetical protein [Pseudomonadota bacterium]HNK43725.1 hypothetical protein [Pseudomonadota bacterium]HNN51051.1 hypothetical protein [Pseudomonadota bacterium]
MLTESQGSAVLRESFLAAGYNIHDNVPFSEDGVAFHVDGFDPVARVGFEFITTEAGDRTELSQETIAKIEQRIARGELFILLVDEYDVATEDELRQYAERFLDMVATRRRGNRE